MTVALHIRDRVLRLERIADGWIGLRGREFAPSTDGVLLNLRREERHTVTMVGVPYPIVALTLDMGGHLLECEDLEPGEVWSPLWPFRYLIEMREGEGSWGRSAVGYRAMLV